MEKPFIVISCFDGMACLRIALERLCITNIIYYASEIDKHAMKVAKKNWPDIIHIGDITKIAYNKGILYTQVGEFEVPYCNLFAGGSPCHGFSFAGKQLNFNDPRSRLFFDFNRLRRQVNADFDFLENVRMKKSYQDVISQYMMEEPILINSALVSAQTRKRLYWTNLPCVGQPVDKGIFLKDILETDKNLLQNYKVKKTPSRIKMWAEKCKNITHLNKSQCVVPKVDRWSNAGLLEFEDFCRYLTPIESERLQTVPDNYTESVSDTQRYKMLGNGWNIDTIVHLLQPIKQWQKH